MLVLAVLLLAGLLFGVAAVSVGHGSPLSDTSPDRREPLLPGRRIAADDVEALEFTMAIRGYRMDEVDQVLDRLAAELAVREAEISRLKGEAPSAEPAPQEAPAAEAPVESLREPASFDPLSPPPWGYAPPVPPPPHWDAPPAS